MRSFLRRPAVGAALTVALTVALTACDSGSAPVDHGPSPQTAGAALADGLESGDLGGLHFLDQDAHAATEDFAEVVAGMGKRRPLVGLGRVSQDGDEATVELAWTWQLTPQQEWKYDSTARLVRDGDNWQVDWSRAVVEPALTAASVLNVTTLPAKRGDITGARGAKLVTERPVVRVGIDKSMVGKKQAAASAKRLAKLAGVEAKPFAERVRSAGDRAFVEAIVFRQKEVPDKLIDGFEAIKGARLIVDEMSLGLTKQFAAPILGRVGEVTAELIAANPDLYEVGDMVGLSGLQSTYDKQLQGVDGVVVEALGSDGKQREIHRIDAEQGTALELTLDKRLQLLAEQVLADVGPPSALVAIRPSDGAVLAAANGPGNEGQNFAMLGQYAPGSTFKSVSALALLRRGLTPSTRVPCTATVNVDGRDFKNYDNYPASGLGDIPFATAIANSCNTAFIASRGELNNGDLAKAAGSLGMGVEYALGYPAFLGQVTDGRTETEEGANMIGQGTILASPLSMAAVIASIQGGQRVLPRLVDDVEVEPKRGSEPVSKEEAATLRELLRGVVKRGSASALRDVPGKPVIAKTGTAEYTNDAKQLRNHAWMIAAQGDLAVAVLVADGASGSSTAGPLVEKFLRGARRS